jgi:hypothetical protein
VENEFHKSTVIREVGSMFSKTLSVVSFFGALAIGVAAAFVVNPWSNAVVAVDVPVRLEDNSCRYGRPRMSNSTRVEAKDLIGRWRGNWGYGDKEAMIYIDRVEGNRFYGNLTVHGAQVALEGTVDSGEIDFRETKVLTIDKSLGKWSLGKDYGTFSTDGGSMFGDGQDEYGFYEWSMTKTSEK